MAYADRFGLDHSETDAFIEIVSEMDAAWIAWHEKREDKRREADSKSEKK